MAMVSIRRSGKGAVSGVGFGCPSYCGHGSRKEFVELRSAKAGGWVPALGAIEAVGQYLAAAADLVGALYDISEGIGVGVQKKGSGTPSASCQHSDALR